MAMVKMFRVIGLLLVLLASACQKKSAVNSGGSAAEVAQTASAGSFLAYEHALVFDTPIAQHAARLEAVRRACTASEFGACSVLEIQQSAAPWSGTRFRLRAVPAAIDPLIQRAGDGDSPVQRESKAEDLADAVSDTAARQALLTRQREQLVAFSERRDLSASDLIALAQQMAGIEAELHQLSGTAAHQQRRLETNLLSIQWRDPDAHQEKEQSISGLLDTFLMGWRDGLESVAEQLGYFLPLLLVAFPIALTWRWAWRRLTRT